MVNLWERMNHIFLHKFSTTCGISAVNADGTLTDVAQTWASGLRGVSGEMLASGLRALIDSGSEWPPSLPEFRAMCNPNRPPHLRPQLKALPAPPWDRDKAADGISAMRSILGRP